jgi:hypothetical protein
MERFHNTHHRVNTNARRWKQFPRVLFRSTGRSMEQRKGFSAPYLGPDEDRSGRRAAAFAIPPLFDLTHVYPAMPVHCPQGISRHPP